MRLLTLRFIAGTVLLTIAFATMVGCSDKTSTPENQALTKKRQDLINSRKGQDDPGANAQTNKQNTGD